MTIASIIKPVTKVGFLLQYYLLLLFVFLKNLYYMVTRHPEANSDDFSILPMKKVHPLVFAHTRSIFSYHRLTHQTLRLHILNPWKPNWRRCCSFPLENSSLKYLKMEHFQPHSHSAWASWLLNVMVSPLTKVIPSLIQRKKSPFCSCRRRVWRMGRKQSRYSLLWYKQSSSKLLGV